MHIAEELKSPGARVSFVHSVCGVYISDFPRVNGSLVYIQWRVVYMEITVQKTKCHVLIEAKHFGLYEAWRGGTDGRTTGRTRTHRTAGSVGRRTRDRAGAIRGDGRLADSRAAAAAAGSGGARGLRSFQIRFSFPLAFRSLRFILRRLQSTIISRRSFFVVFHVVLALGRDREEGVGL